MAPATEVVTKLRGEVRRLTEADAWHEADRPTAELVGLEPDSHWANAQRSEVVHQLWGSAAAQPFADRALDAGFCCQRCSAQIERVLWAAGDPERALRSSAVTRILSRVGNLPVTLGRVALDAAIETLQSSASRGDEPPAARGLRVIALIRGGRLADARAELAQLPDDAFDDTTAFEVTTMRGQLAFRMGLVDEAVEILGKRIQEDDPSWATFATLSLALGHRDGSWGDQAGRLDELGSAGKNDLATHTAAIAHTFAGDAAAARASLELALSRDPAFSLELVARALVLGGDDPGLAARQLLMAAAWDSTGDCFDPIGRSVIDRVMSDTPAKPLGLGAIQAMLCLDQLSRSPEDRPIEPSTRRPQPSASRQGGSGSRARELAEMTEEIRRVRDGLA